MKTDVVSSPGAHTACLLLHFAWFLFPGGWKQEVGDREVGV